MPNLGELWVASVGAHRRLVKLIGLSLEQVSCNAAEQG